MSKNIRELPATEIVERVEELSRSEENVRRKIRGVIDDVYLREIAAKWDWSFYLSSSSLVTTVQHRLGTASINTGDTVITFSSDAAITAEMTGRKIKLSANPVVYDFTFTDNTGGTIVPSLEGNANLNGTAYQIFQPAYSLAADFDRFPKDGGTYSWQGGRKAILPEESYQENTEMFQPTPGTPAAVRIMGTDTAGNELVVFRPPPSMARVYGYDYFRRPRPLEERTDGTVTISAGGTAVTGNVSSFTEMTTGDFLRVDAFGTADDSQWYRILNIASNSDLTLSSAFANSAVTSANYVIARAPEMPVKMQPAVLFGALRTMLLDQNDEASVYYNNKMAEVMTDSKRVFMTRVYSQEIEHIAEDWRYRR